MTAQRSAADLVLSNGRIYTVDPQRSWASAVAVKSGRIIAVGDDAAVKALIGPETKIIDLAGRMAMPGIVDVHTHILMGGQAELYELRFPSTIGLQDICARVRAYAETTAPGQWILGGQWGSDMLDRLDTAEALAMLDEASLGHPVMLRDDTYHNRWANSEAMRRAGITLDTPNPSKGEVRRDAKTGALTGMLIENASGLIERCVDQSGHYSLEMNQAAVARAIASMNSYGITAFLDAASMQPLLAALKGLDDRGDLTAWSLASMPAVEPSFLFGLAGDDLIAIRENYRSAHVKPDFVKVFLDGVPGAKTAAFHEPYVADLRHGCCFRGATMLSVPDLVRWVGKCERHGLAIKIHCAGDAAVTQALDAIDVARSFNGPTDLVHHIAHASYIAPGDIARFAELGVAADLSPFIWYPTSFLEGHKVAMGAERATRFWPNKDLRAAGALMAGGTDWPVVPNPDPWDGIEGLVTRQNPSGEFPGQSLWPEQALDLAAVLEIFTINAAKAVGLGTTIGSIEVGKSADIIVLDRDVFAIAPTDLADTKVQLTLFEGRVVHERGAA